MALPGTAEPSRRFPGSGIRDGASGAAGKEGCASPPVLDKGPGGARAGPMAIPMVPMETQLQSIFEEVVVSPSPERCRCRGSAVGRPAARPGPCGPPCSLYGGSGEGGAILKEMESRWERCFWFSGRSRCGAAPPPSPVCLALFPAAGGR